MKPSTFAPYLPGLGMSQPTDLSVSRNELLNQIFELHSSKSPNNIAVVDGDCTYSYEFINSEANRLARYLISKNVSHGSYVGILLNRGVQVYISILAVLKSGAAYVPIDPEYPSERVQHILEDSQAAFLLTSKEFVAKHPSIQSKALLLDDIHGELQLIPSTNVDLPESSNDAPCYIIFTSGSTGRPKGVLITHRNACNLVRTSQLIYHPTPEDKVFQGFSTAFDAAVEEVWLAFGSGATLVVGTKEVMRSGPALASILRANQVTILSCVPTLLATVEEDIPSLRLLILGGEVCPADLIARWWTPSRRILNTYGPTEATVIATWTECHPLEAVTIGKPLVNYDACILDQNLNPMPVGEPGELHICGVGIAKGYVGRPELTEAKFIPNPFPHTDDYATLYKTGDLAAWDENGNIRFLGRIDDQIKFRGFRIELSEIETVIRNQRGVLNCVVAVKERTPGVQTLAAYITKHPEDSLDTISLLKQVRTLLPGYMVPSTMDVIDEIPVLSSGKADRSRLPEPGNASNLTTTYQLNPVEQKIAEIWEHVFQLKNIDPDADFFMDLGGHSLIAALVTSEMRRTESLKLAAVADIYSYPTVRKLARAVALQLNEKDSTSVTSSTASPKQLDPNLKRRHFLCGSAQLIILFLMTTLVTAEMSLPLRLLQLGWHDASKLHWTMLGASILSAILILPLNLFIAIASKWLIIGKFREGDYPLWSLYYLRLWTVRKMQSLSPVSFLSGTPVYNLYLKALGAKVATDSCFASASITCYDLVEVGSGTSIGNDAHLNGYHVDNGVLHIGKITIGNNSRVGHNALLSPNSSIGNNAELADQSMLLEGGNIPDNQKWAGSPAVDSGEKLGSAFAQIPVKRLTGFSIYSMLYLVFLDTALLLSTLPSVILLYGQLERVGPVAAICSTPVAAALWVVLFCGELVILNKLAGKTEHGLHPLYGSVYAKRWSQDRLMMLSLGMNQAMYATVYLPKWLKLMGAKIGGHAEISTAAHIMPDLLEFGAGSFIADAVCAGPLTVRGGMVSVQPTIIGANTFIGNSAYIPSGCKVPNDCLVGCMSTPPVDREEMQEGQSWLGSPAIYLPKRQVSKSFSSETTYHPTTSLYIQRSLIEALRVTGPGIFSGVGFVLWMLILRDLAHHLDLFHWVVEGPVFLLCMSCLTVGIVAALKWIIIGKYKTDEQPLWSNFVWRTELITAMFENVAIPALLGSITGTPFLPMALRLFGTKMGKRVWIDTLHISEFDLVTVGDEANINSNATLQTHLFEDRVMKLDHLRVEDNCTLGEVSVVLYSSVMEKGSTLDALSLLMKGETLPENTAWRGIPARSSSTTPVPHAAQSKLPRRVKQQGKKPAVKQEEYLIKQ